MVHDSQFSPSECSIEYFPAMWDVIIFSQYRVAWGGHLGFLLYLLNSAVAPLVKFSGFPLVVTVFLLDNHCFSIRNGQRSLEMLRTEKLHFSFSDNSHAP